MNVFKDLKVIELASVLAGPATGTFFAELGAEVIKIENKKTGGDITRSWKTAGENPDAPISAYYASANWGKKVIFADLSLPEERKEILELIEQADVVITNFKAGADKKLGMDYESLSGINPSLIYASITGYGDEEPRPAFDALLQAETGFMSMNGSPDSGPVKMPVAMIDLLAAHQLKEGILIALLQRGRNNRGARVSVSLYDAAIASLANQASNWLMNRHLPQRMGSLHPNIAPYGDIFHSKDGHEIMLAVGTDEQFRTLARILENTSLAADEKLLSNAQRVINREYLQEQLTPCFQRKNAGELLSELLNANIPAAMISDLEKVFETPEAQRLVATEITEGVPTKSVKTAVFRIHPFSG